jgi:hypothetical protein
VSAKQRISLFPRQLGIAHLCHLRRAKTPTSPNRLPLGRKINLDRLTLRLLSQRRKHCVRIASLQDSHGFTILKPSGNAAKVIAQISDIDRVHDTLKYHKRVAPQHAFFKQSSDYTKNLPHQQMEKMKENVRFDNLGKTILSLPCN